MKKIFCLVVLLGACKKAPPTLVATGISASVVFTGTVTQFSFEAFSGTAVVGPLKTEPSTAGAALKSPYATDFEFDDSLAGTSVRISAQALSAGATVGVASASVTLVKGVLTPLTITIVAPACGDGIVTAPETCDDGNILSGDGCSATCQIEVAPPAVCGNGILEAGEGCDIATATSPGCSTTCVLTAGWSCTATGCTDNNCGNSVIDTGELCDDGNTTAGDGCDSNCQIEVPWNCTNPATGPSCCQLCGNNTIDNPTQCADLPPSEVETCDGTDLSGYSCLAAGQLNEGPGNPLGVSMINKLKCDGSDSLTPCGGYDLSGCGAAISAPDKVQLAIAEAKELPGHDTIALMPGNYTQTIAFSIDECGGACLGAAAPPSGMTFVPYGGGNVSIVAGPSALAVFDVKSGYNKFVGLNFVMSTGADYAIFSENLANQDGHNAILGCTFSTPATLASNVHQGFLSIQTDDNVVGGNDFHNASTVATYPLTNAIGASGSNNIFYDNLVVNDAGAQQLLGISLSTAGITPNGTQILANAVVNENATDPMNSGLDVSGSMDTVLAMNLIEGSFTSAVSVDTSDATLIDNNSLHTIGSNTFVFGTGSSGATNTCFRNNIVDSTVTMAVLGTSTFGLASNSCGGVPSNNNDYFGQAAPCSGSCTGLCTAAGTGPLCDLDIDPGYATLASGPSGLCLNTASTPVKTDLVNQGLSILCSGSPCYDMVDDKPNVLYYEGSAIDVGARESGTTRTFGTGKLLPASTCP